MLNIILLIMMSLAIGSFINLIIYRILRNKSLWRPRSHCPLCGHTLQPWDLIPVFSYIFIGGRCRFCKQHISLRYLLVEIITALSYVQIYLRWGFSLASLIGWLFTALLIICAYTDIEEGIIPDLVTYPGIILGLVLSFFSIGISTSVIGLLMFVSLFLLAALLSKGGMGGGDIKLAGLIGAFLGFQGSLFALVISSLSGGLWAAGLLILGNAHRKTAIRFGPFLAIAAWLVWMYERDISDFYWQIFF